MEEYLGDQLDYKAADEGFQGTEEEYRRHKSTSEEDRTFLADGSDEVVEIDFASAEDKAFRICWQLIYIIKNMVVKNLLEIT